MLLLLYPEGYVVQQIPPVSVHRRRILCWPRSSPDVLHKRAFHCRDKTEKHTRWSWRSRMSTQESDTAR